MKKHPPAELRQLDFLIGDWQSSGKVLAAAGEPEMLIRGTDAYHWALGGFYLLHRAEVYMGAERVEVTEFIGDYDPADLAFTMRAFDNRGNFTTMKATLEKDKVLLLTGEGIRSRLEAGSGRMTASWERNEKGTWLPWMDMFFTK